MVAVLGAVALWPVATAPGAVVAATAPEPAVDIVAARRSANALAEQYFEAEAELDALAIERENLERQVVDLEDAVDDSRSRAVAVAVESFIGESGPVLPVFTDPDGPLDREVERVLAGVAVNRTSTDIDDFEAAVEALERGQADLAAATRTIEHEQAQLDELRELALARVAVLRDTTAPYLDADADAAANAAVAANDRQIWEEAVAAAAVERDRHLASLAGGRTGQDGAGSRPVVPRAGILCPVVGASGFANTWGQPRSGGRRHQGVDMLAPSGTPLQAVVSGRVVRRTNRLGGVTLSLHGENGTRYYYAHLRSYAGSEGEVSAGQVIGYVGDTGNASGTPHLHFEIHPGGGTAINPYPAVVDAGC